MTEENILKNRTQIIFDYQNLYGQGKITKDDIKDISLQIEKAALAIKTMRQTGVIKGHLSKDGLPEKVLFSQLPYIKDGNINTLGTIEQLIKFGKSLKYTTDTVISFGIGGSFLGNKVLFDVGCGEFWNQQTVSQRNGYPKLYFSGNNVDAASTTALLQTIISAAQNSNLKRPYKVVMLVNSKSGSTLETMACFMYMLQEFKKYEDIITVKIVAVTDPTCGDKQTLLHRLAEQNNWELFRVPDGVGGRFSVFSDVGLVSAVATGLDIKEFLQGAKDMDEACQSDDVFENMALLNATLKFIAGKKYNRTIEVFMPYADSLKSLSEWYIQLLAESLGKEKNRNGDKVYYGRTPIVAVGTTDMHAQTQQHQEGMYDKVVQFIKIDDWDKNPIIPNLFKDEKVLQDMSQVSFGDALKAALDSNAQALISNKRFNATFILPKINLYYVGALMYMLCLSVAYEGELADIDAFDQPGVEAYKIILKSKLSEMQKQVR